MDFCRPLRISRLFAVPEPEPRQSSSNHRPASTALCRLPPQHPASSFGKPPRRGTGVCPKRLQKSGKEVSTKSRTDIFETLFLTFFQTFSRLFFQTFFFCSGPEAPRGTFFKLKVSFRAETPVARRVGGGGRNSSCTEIWDPLHKEALALNLWGWPYLLYF